MVRTVPYMKSREMTRIGSHITVIIYLVFKLIKLFNYSHNSVVLMDYWCKKLLFFAFSNHNRYLFSIGYGVCY